VELSWITMIRKSSSGSTTRTVSGLNSICGLRDNRDQRKLAATPCDETNTDVTPKVAI